MAYFAEKNYFEDQELMELTQRVMSGDLTLTWWDAKTERVRFPRFLGSPRVCMPRSLTPASSSRLALLGVSTRPSVFLTTSALAGIIELAGGSGGEASLTIINISILN